MGNIVTNGLVLNLDAANAKQDLRPYANGCASTDLSWFDLSSSAFTGTLTNFASCGGTTGWNGSGGAADPYRITFDGSNDFVSIPYSSILDFGTGNFTVELWEKTSYTAAYQSLFAKDTAASGNGIDLYINQTTGFLRTWVGGATRNGTINIADGLWHHVVVVRNSGTVTHYIDGASDGSASAVGSTNTASSKVWIGRTDDNVYYFNGSVPKVSAYSRALSGAEITQNCNALKSRFSGATCH